MSRRSSRKSAVASYAETPDREIEKGVVAIDEEVSEESGVKKRGAKAEVKKETAVAVNGKTGAAKPSKPAAGKRKASEPDDEEAETKPAPKRKIKDEDDEGDEKVVEKPAKKPVKKRKTKEETENDAMPVAARTAVSTLKRKMYFGAHISAAGGKSP